MWFQSDLGQTLHTKKKITGWSRKPMYFNKVAETKPTKGHTLRKGSGFGREFSEQKCLQKPGHPSCWQNWASIEVHQFLYFIRRERPYRIRTVKKNSMVSSGTSSVHGSFGISRSCWNPARWNTQNKNQMQTFHVRGFCSSGRWSPISCLEEWSGNRSFSPLINAVKGYLWYATHI